MKLDEAIETILKFNVDMINHEVDQPGVTIGRAIQISMANTAKAMNMIEVLHDKISADELEHVNNTEKLFELIALHGDCQCEDCQAIRAKYNPTIGTLQ